MLCIPNLDEKKQRALNKHQANTGNISRDKQTGVEFAIAFSTWMKNSRERDRGGE